MRTRSIATILVIVIVLIAVALVAARLYLPHWVKNYLNAELASMEGYDGSIDDVDIHLYRGAYSIHKLQIRKTDGAMPVPFIDIESTDISVEWGALLKGRVVAEIDVNRPVINFAVNKSGTVTQTGQEVDWSEKIKSLAPIDINHVTITEGKLSYQNFSTSPEVDMYLHHIRANITNLRNVEDANEPLPSHVTVSADSIGKGKFVLQGKMNILKTIPDMDVNAKLEKVNLPALNDYFRAFAAIDVERGRFDGYVELKVKDGAVSGYVKPIASDIALIDLKRDANPLKLIWESLASVVIELFTNQRTNQFATQVPLEGNINDIETNRWEALVGIIRNAFIKAVDRGFAEG